MLTTKKIECPVCGEEVPYTDVKNPPTTCWRTMCRTNYNHVAARSTITGKAPDIKEVGKWKPFSDLKRSKKE